MDELVKLGPYDSVMMRLNRYQMGNLIDAIGQVQENGDWYGEFCNMVAYAMRIADIRELRSNRGFIYTLDDVEKRNIQHYKVKGGKNIT